MPRVLHRVGARLWRVTATTLFAVGVTSACFAPGQTPDVSPHHDDPFMTCVREHETGGNYTIDSPDGLYHGAYQFLQSTWDATAQHIARFDLIGVDPHTTSPATQDDMAWALYQWQGTSPWAGSGCA